MVIPHIKNTLAFPQTKILSYLRSCKMPRIWTPALHQSWSLGLWTIQYWRNSCTASVLVPWSMTPYCAEGTPALHQSWSLGLWHHTVLKELLHCISLGPLVYDTILYWRNSCTGSHGPMVFDTILCWRNSCTASLNFPLSMTLYCTLFEIAVRSHYQVWQGCCTQETGASCSVLWQDWASGRKHSALR